MIPNQRLPSKKDLRRQAQFNKQTLLARAKWASKTRPTVEHFKTPRPDPDLRESILFDSECPDDSISQVVKYMEELSQLSRRCLSRASKKELRSPENDLFEQLPDHLIFHICSFLELKEILHVPLVCKRWFKAVWENADWLSKKGWVTIHHPDNDGVLQSTAHLESLRNTRLASFKMFRFGRLNFSVFKTVLPMFSDIVGLRFDAHHFRNETDASKLLCLIADTCKNLTIFRAVFPEYFTLTQPCTPFPHVSDLDLGSLIVSRDTWHHTWRNLTESFPALRTLRKLVVEGYGPVPVDLPIVSFKIVEVAITVVGVELDVQSLLQFCRHHDVSFVSPIFSGTEPGKLLEIASSWPQLVRLEVRSCYVDFKDPFWGKLDGLTRLTVHVTTRLSPLTFIAVLQTFPLLQRVTFEGEFFDILGDFRSVYCKLFAQALAPLVRIDFNATGHDCLYTVSCVKEQTNTWRVAKKAVGSQPSNRFIVRSNGTSILVTILPPDWITRQYMDESFDSFPTVIPAEGPQKTWEPPLYRPLSLWQDWGPPLFQPLRLWRYWERLLYNPLKMLKYWSVPGPVSGSLSGGSTGSSSRGTHRPPLRNRNEEARRRLRLRLQNRSRARRSGVSGH